MNDIAKRLRMATMFDTGRSAFMFERMSAAELDEMLREAADALEQEQFNNYHADASQFLKERDALKARVVELEHSLEGRMTSEQAHRAWSDSGLLERAEKAEARVAKLEQERDQYPAIKEHAAYIAKLEAVVTRARAHSLYDNADTRHLLRAALAALADHDRATTGDEK